MEEDLDEDILACLDDLDDPSRKRKKKNKNNLRKPSIEAQEMILNPENSRRPVKKFDNLNLDFEERKRNYSLGGHNQSNTRNIIYKNKDENCRLI